jgi:hypothetical protein
MASKWTFLDQINGLQTDIFRPKDGLKRVESLFVILKQMISLWSLLIISKCLQMPKWLSEGEVKEDIGLNRLIEKNEGKWIL